MPGVTIRGWLVVRPEPGNGRTAIRLREAAGPARDVAQLPLFSVHAVAWQAPAPDGFDALLLTSANAVRHGGEGLAALRALPVVAVGEATATAARGAGFSVAVVGDGDASAAIAQAGTYGFRRLLRLAGRDHAPGAAGAVTGMADTHIVYASDPLPITAAAIAAADRRLVLLHSSRAAHRFADLVDDAGLDRSRIGVVALSQAVLAAAGSGWLIAEACSRPCDTTLVAAAVALADQRAIDRSPGAGDKRP